MKTKIIVIVGPTAVGKTALSIDLAKRFNGEIISGDSQQVYRKLDIGTAKVTPDEQEEIPHYLIDVREVTESYSAFDFVKESEAAIEMIVAEGKLPIIDVLSAQVSWLQAYTNVVSVNYQYKVALAEYAKALGGTDR